MEPVTELAAWAPRERTPRELLEEEFRAMIIQVAKGLKREDCEYIAYLKELPKGTCSPEPDKDNIRLFVLVTLHACGHISPLNPDALQSLLKLIHRQDLTHFVEEYITKQAPLLKKIEKDQRKKSTKKRGKKNGESQKHAGNIEQLGSSTKEMLAIKAASSKKEQLKKLQTLTLSHISQLMLRAQELHAAINDDTLPEIDLSRTEETFRAVVEETGTFDRKLRKDLSAVGISSSKDSSSSEESGVTGFGHDAERCSDIDSPATQKKTRSPIVPPKGRQPSSAAHTPSGDAHKYIVSLPPPTPPTKHPRYNLYEGQQLDNDTVSSRSPLQGRKPPIKPRTLIASVNGKKDHVDSSQAAVQDAKAQQDNNGEETTGTDDSGVGDIKKWTEGHLYETVGHAYEPITMGNRSQNEYTSPVMKSRAGNQDGVAAHTH